MEQKFFHGSISPQDVARELVAEFNRGNFRAQTLPSPEKTIVQIATTPHSQSGGQTALTISIQKQPDGIQIQIGQQAWLGLAGSLATTAFSVLRNPLSFLSRIDDLAQDIESLQLTETIWKVIEKTARASGANQELSERLARVACGYCHTANPVGEANCISCGGPLGKVQPRTCPVCGFVSKTGEEKCTSCGAPLPA